jgi:hypothetical protein
VIPHMILHECARRGVTVRLDEGELRLCGENGSVTGGLIESARRHKSGLVALLPADGPAPNLVHSGTDLVHEMGKPSPVPGGSGLPARTASNASNQGGAGRERERERLSLKNSPLSPPFCPDIHPPRVANITRPEEGFRPSEGGAEILISCNPPPILPERGLSGPSGLPKVIGVLGRPERWGPFLDHDEPPTDVPADHWRWRVAHLPHAEWIAWRARSGALQAEFSRAIGGLPLDADEIIECDQLAAAEVGGSRCPPPDPAQRRLPVLRIVTIDLDEDLGFLDPRIGPAVATAVAPLTPDAVDRRDPFSPPDPGKDRP